MSTLSKLAISGAAVVLIVIRFIWPTLAVDAITTGLLVVAGLPWIAPLIESFKLSGGAEVKLRDLQVAESKIDSLARQVSNCNGVRQTGRKEPVEAGRSRTHVRTLEDLSARCRQVAGQTSSEYRGCAGDK